MLDPNKIANIYLEKQYQVKVFDYVKSKVTDVKSWNFEDNRDRDMVYFDVLTTDFKIGPAAGNDGPIYTIKSAGLHMHVGDIADSHPGYSKPALKTIDGSYDMPPLDEERRSYFGDRVKVNNRERISLTDITEHDYTSMYEKLKKIASKIQKAVNEFVRSGEGQPEPAAEVVAARKAVANFYQRWSTGKTYGNFRNVNKVTDVSGKDGWFVGAILNRPQWNKKVNQKIPESIPAHTVFQLVAVGPEGQAQKFLTSDRYFYQDHFNFDTMDKEVDELNKNLDILYKHGRQNLTGY